jgi:hypothetical protein
MYQTVLDVFDANEPAYMGVPACVKTVNELRNQVTNILTVSKQQDNIRPTAVSDVKNSVIDRLIELCMKIADPLYAYAFETDDKYLLTRMSVNKSMFYAVQNRALLSLAKIIAENANIHAYVLRDYGVTDNDCAELNEAIAQFEKLMTAPSGEIGKRKVQTSTLRELFVQTDSLIYDKLDKIMRPFKTSNPDLFALYGNARNVINTAARKRKTKDAES